MEYQKMCIYAVADADAKDGFTLTLVPEEKRWWMSESDVCIGITTVSYNPPENMSREQMALKAVETLRDRIKQTQAEAQLKVNRLQERINNLLLLTHQPEPDQSDSNENDNVVEFTKRTGTDDIDELPF